VASKGKARGLGEIFCRWQKLWYSASFWFSRLSEVNRTKESKGFGLRGNHALCVKICMVVGVQDGQREASRTILHVNCTASGAWGSSASAMLPMKWFYVSSKSSSFFFC
jgi:hypothetical protein